MNQQRSSRAERLATAKRWQPGTRANKVAWVICGVYSFVVLFGVVGWVLWKG